MGTSRIRRHFFVCTNERPVGGRPACGARGAEVARALAAAAVAQPDVQVTACGCLGPCFDGPTVVVYPEAAWYGGVAVEDAAALVADAAVERLRIAFPDEE